jgi:hypothetical protein
MYERVLTGKSAQVHQKKRVKSGNQAKTSYQKGARAHGKTQVYLTISVPERLKKSRKKDTLSGIRESQVNGKRKNVAHLHQNRRVPSAVSHKYSINVVTSAGGANVPW